MPIDRVRLKRFLNHIDPRNDKKYTDIITEKKT